MDWLLCQLIICIDLKKTCITEAMHFLSFVDLTFFETKATISYKIGFVICPTVI